VAAEAVLHDALEGAPGDALQQAVISFLCIRLGSQHSRNERLQCLPADKQINNKKVTTTTTMVYGLQSKRSELVNTNERLTQQAVILCRL